MIDYDFRVYCFSVLVSSEINVEINRKKHTKRANKKTDLIEAEETCFIRLISPVLNLEIL